jgi:hypothetical protein
MFDVSTRRLLGAACRAPRGMMKRKSAILTLPCAAGLLLCSSNAQAQLDPWNNAYGIQWTDQKGGNSSALDGRGGSVRIDPITGMVIVGVESQDATFGPIEGGT